MTAGMLVKVSAYSRGNEIGHVYEVHRVRVREVMRHMWHG